MNRKVKTRTTYVLEGAGFGSTGDEGNERLASIEHFDINGRSVELVVYDNREAEQERTLREYDAQGRMIAEATEDVLTSSFDKRRIVYDDVAHTVEEIQYYGDDEGERTMTTHSPDGHVMEITKFNVDGELELRQVFGYDEKGQCILDEEYESDILAKKVLTYYNDAGLMSGQGVSFELNPEDNHVITYSYPEGQEVSEARDMDGELLWRETTHLDQHGNHIETIHEDLVDQTRSHHVTRAFDDNHLVLAEQYNHSHQLEYRTQVTYDEGRPSEEAVFYSAAYRGVATHIIRRFRYEFHG